VRAARSSSIALAGCALALAQCGGGAARDERPNVVLIVADDLDVGLALDTRRPDTGELAYPHLHSLGERGVVFTSSFVSHPLCSPSRASMLTGQYDHNHGVTTNQLDGGNAPILEQQPTLAGWLQASGYTTALVGKYINEYGRDELEPDARAPIPAGWTHWFATMNVSSYLEWRAVRDGEVEDHTGARQEYLTDALGREAVRAIDAAAAGSKPLFLMLAFKAPHDGRDDQKHAPLPAPRHAKAFDAFEPQWPPSFDEADMSDKPPNLAKFARVGAKAVQSITERMRARREAMLAVDEAVGAVLGALAAHGMSERTVVIFTSDNGYEQGEHRLIGKGRPYEESIRVPLVACGPGIPPGTRCDELVLNLDLAPTIAELAGAKPSRVVDGRSWLALLRDPATPWRRDFLLLSMHAPPFAGVRTRTRMYAEHDVDLDGHADARELYWLAADERNAQADPHQLESLAGDPRYRDVVDELRARLERLRTCRGTSCW
jgi:arylsulfatase A-like enzyme